LNYDWEEADPHPEENQKSEEVPFGHDEKSTREVSGRI
jgi:hypothetical protein